MRGSEGRYAAAAAAQKAAQIQSQTGDGEMSEMDTTGGEGWKNEQNRLNVRAGKMSDNCGV